MPYYTYTDILLFLSKAYHGYIGSHDGKLPNTIWVSIELYNAYKNGLIANIRFTSIDDIPIRQRLKYKSAWVEPVNVPYTQVLKTTRCTGRYNG